MSGKTIYIVGHAKLPQGASAHTVFGTLSVSAEIDRKYGVIVKASCSLTHDDSVKFVSSILVGHSLLEGVEELIQEIRGRYYGLTQDAIVAAIKDLYRKFTTLKDMEK